MRALALDEAGRDDVRREQRARLFLRDQLLQRRVVVAHVADRGDAGGQMQAAFPRTRVRVHVEQAGQQRRGRQHRSTWSALRFSAPALADRDDAAVLQISTSLGAAASVAFSLSKMRALRISVVPASGCARRCCIATSSFFSAAFCCVSRSAPFFSQPSSISCRKPGKMNANRRGESPVVAQANVGVKPMPVIATSCTLRLSAPLRHLDVGELLPASACRSGSAAACRRCAWRARRRRPRNFPACRRAACTARCRARPARPCRSSTSTAPCRPCARTIRRPSAPNVDWPTTW